MKNLRQHLKMLEHKPTLFEILDHGYSLYHTDYSQNIILQSKIQEYSWQIRELKKEISFLNTTAQELKYKKVLLEKVKDDPNPVLFILFLEIIHWLQYSCV